MRASGIMLIGTVTGWIAIAAFPQGQSVVDTPHNLSVSGPGVIRAVTEEQVCIFCHTPHNASPIQPLWNRYLPVSAYTVYSSNALDALPGQPTGSSKMCLSCHDGSIALGSVFSRDEIIQMAGGITTLPPGASNIGTDLSDDHPISFAYDASLVAKDPKLVDPALLPEELRLDENEELQCTTCHDAHDNTFTHFLVMSNGGSDLCRSCHQISTTTIPHHQDCNACHRAHTAPSGPYLLTDDRITTTCLTCHDGSYPGAKDIASDLQKYSIHDTNSPVDPPDPLPDHVTCADCHNPHTMTNGSSQAPNIPTNFGQVAGVSASGGHLDVASYEYEVCFKCHADDNAFDAPYIPRQIAQVNTRMEFAPSAISFHPVEVPGKNPDVPSLKPPYSTGSVIYCADCHSSDAGGGGGGGPRGVHGSDNPPLLWARYDTADFTTESADAYALCYHCHYRDGQFGILQDVSFPEHSEHIVDEKTPCSVCHDAHGISSAEGTVSGNSHLINFDTSVVLPDPDTNRLEFQKTGTLSGRCYLYCHEHAHSPEEYN